MTFLVAIYLYALAIVLIWLMFRQHRLGICELFSVRNVAVAGFILFQLSSPSIALLAGNYGDYHLENPTRTALEFAAMATVFLIVSLWSYAKGFGATRLAAMVPATSAMPPAMTFLGMAIVMSALAALFRIGLRIPLINLLSIEIGVGFAAVSCGMVGWVWGGRLLNPALWLYGAIILLINCGVVAYGDYGRRGLVACGAALLWGMYYSHWKYLPTRKILARLALIGAGPLIIIALFTSARQIGSATTAEHIQNISAGSDLGKGLFLLLEGQNTGSGSMWLIEAYPDQFETRPLMTLWHFVIYPVPRMVWEDKPKPLGMLMPRQVRFRNSDNDKLNIGPGIVGSAAAEGGWYALVIYAVLGGLFLRFFDQIVRLNPDAPFVILPIGSSMGQVLGLARGETSAFCFITCLTVFSSLVTMFVVGKAFERMGWTRLTAMDDVDDESAYEEDDSGAWQDEAVPAS
jgi:hypothetical protein